MTYFQWTLVYRDMGGDHKSFFLTGGEAFRVTVAQSSFPGGSIDVQWTPDGRGQQTQTYYVPYGKQHTFEGYTRPAGNTRGLIQISDRPIPLCGFLDCSNDDGSFSFAVEVNRRYQYTAKRKIYKYE